MPLVLCLLILMDIVEFMQVTFIITKQRSSIISLTLTSNLKVLQSLEVKHLCHMFAF